MIIIYTILYLCITHYVARPATQRSSKILSHSFHLNNAMPCCCAGAASVELVSGPAPVTDTAATGRKYQPGFLFNSAGASHNSYAGGTENLLLLAAWTIKLKLFYTLSIVT